VIFYLAAASQAGAMAYFLQHSGKALAKRIYIVPYEQMFAPGATLTLPRGHYLFTGLTLGLGPRFPPSPLRSAALALHARLVDLHGPDRVLNHPDRVLSRYELLRALHACGINQFDAYHPGERPRRYPVYLRYGPGTTQVEPELIYSEAGYDAALAHEPEGHDRVVIEFCDTADADEVYRKYGAFVIGGEVVPRHVFFSRQWFVKGDTNVVTPAQVREELAYLEANPHADALRQACRIAQIDYGRVDYALLDGQPQIWEINHTPTVEAPPPGEIDLRKAVHQRFTELFTSALDRLENA
jgi:hypothetical protein